MHLAVCESAPRCSRGSSLLALAQKVAAAALRLPATMGASRAGNARATTGPPASAGRRPTSEVAAAAQKRSATTAPSGTTPQAAMAGTTARATAPVDRRARSRTRARRAKLRRAAPREEVRPAGRAGRGARVARAAKGPARDAAIKRAIATRARRTRTADSKRLLHRLQHRQQVVQGRCVRVASLRHRRPVRFGGGRLPGHYPPESSARTRSDWTA